MNLDDVVAPKRNPMFSENPIADGGPGSSYEDFVFNPEREINESITRNDQKIHLRVRQRNRRKCYTHVEGLPSGWDLEDIVGKMRKRFSCSGSVCQSTGGLKYILLFGDQRDGAKKFLVENSIAPGENIIKHGY